MAFLFTNYNTMKILGVERQNNSFINSNYFVSISSWAIMVMASTICCDDIAVCDQDRDQAKLRYIYAGFNLVKMDR